MGHGYQISKPVADPEADLDIAEHGHSWSDGERRSGMDVAEHLRSGEFQSIRSAVRDGNSDHARKQLSERGKAQELIRQQYSGRYPPFELLQNANDAAKESGLEEGAQCLLPSDQICAHSGGQRCWLRRTPDPLDLLVGRFFKGSWYGDRAQGPWLHVGR